MAAWSIMVSYRGSCTWTRRAGRGVALGGARAVVGATPSHDVLRAGSQRDSEVDAPGRDGRPARPGPRPWPRAASGHVVARLRHGGAPRRVSRGTPAPIFPQRLFPRLSTEANFPRRQLGAHKRAKAHLGSERSTRSPPSPSQGAPMDEQSTPADMESSPLLGGSPSKPAVALAGRRRGRRRDARGRGAARARPERRRTISQRRRRAGRDLRPVLQVPTTDNTDLVQPPKGAKPLEMGHFGKWTIMASTSSHGRDGGSDVVGV